MTFKDITTALGERLGSELEDAGGAVALEIDGATVILQDADEMLLLHAEIGEIPAYGREALLATAMEANFLYRGTGGATLAIAPANGKLHLQKYNWTARMDVDTVIDTLERFASTVNSWKRLLADYRPESDTPDIPVPPHNHGFIMA